MYYQRDEIYNDRSNNINLIIGKSETGKSQLVKKEIKGLKTNKANVIYVIDAKNEHSELMKLPKNRYPAMLQICTNQTKDISKLKSAFDRIEYLINNTDPGNQVCVYVENFQPTGLNPKILKELEYLLETYPYTLQTTFVCEADSIYDLSKQFKGNASFLSEYRKVTICKCEEF